MNPAFQLILLPGLGTDYRLLEPQREAFPDMTVPPWIAPRTGESLPDYAARLAESVRPAGDVPLVLGGVSLGGMLAYEMSRHLKPAAVVLIASCRTARALRPGHRLGRRLLPVMPVQVWNLAKLLAGPFVRSRIGVPRARQDLAIAMFRQSDCRFMHWALQAILNWEPAPLEGVRIKQIHGRRDFLIPASRVHADQWVSDGGHLINMTHSAEVNDFVRRALET
jgi:pimeloyl-ACP methyl ester carboxylesterase